MSWEDELERYDESSDVAIVGMSLRVPGARSLEEYWRNLRGGVESISFFSPEEVAAEGYVEDERGEDRTVVRAGGLLDDVDLFDADFFGFNRREAEITDPQVRLLLETSWEALEHAGCAPSKSRGRSAVFAGVSLGTYLFSNIFPNDEILRTTGRSRLMMGNHPNFLTTWISYKLDLRGPSVAVQTACSTSLVAVHLGVQSLLNGECDTALCGAASISLPQRASYVYREGGIHSPDGRCRAFDADADGTVGGNGVGTVVLKRLGDALRDGHVIHGVIKGSAVNNDGSLKIGYTAPSVEGQAEVVVEALSISGCHPDSISYIEAHGTGTPLGDPIEISALTQAFRARTERSGYCAVGSVKPNIGHLDTVAGVAGLIKAVLALRHRELPPTLHFRAPNPKCAFETSPFFVNAELRPWEAPDGGPLRAGVSSLGIGGTNAHVIVEEAPEPPPSGPGRRHQLLCLSAKSAEALAEARERLAAFLRRENGPALADTAFTLHRGRADFPHRLAFTAASAAEAASLLAGEGGSFHTGVEETRRRPVTFLFPGQGSQAPGYGRELYRDEAVFRESVDRSCEILKQHLESVVEGGDLRPLLFPPPEADPEEAAERLTRTAVAQTALVVLEIALARLWESLGIRPQAVVGHSVGEYAAAHVAGVMSLEDALRLTVARGRLMAELPPGAMLAVSGEAEELAGDLAEVGGGLALAAINAPGRCVVSGPEEAVAALEARLTGKGKVHRRLAVAHAFHSPAVDPVLEPLAAILAEVELRPPEVPFVRGLTGTFSPAPGSPDGDAPRVEEAAYWLRQTREAVRFGDAAGTLLAEPDRLYLEVGPGQALAQLMRGRRDALGERPAVFASLPKAPPPAGAPGGAPESREQASDPAREGAQLLLALGGLWAAGLDIAWAPLYREQRRRRVELPTYAFQRRRYWVDPPGAAERDARRDAAPARRVARASSPGAISAAAGGTPPASPDPAAMVTATAVAEASPPVLTAPAAGREQSRRGRILDRLGEVVRKLTGAEPEEIDSSASFFELGVDSLMLIQASELIRDEVGMEVPFRALFEELASLDALADFLDEKLPPEALPAPPPPPAAASPPPTPSAGAGNDAFERLVDRQLETLRAVMAEQLAAFRGGAAPDTPSVAAPAPGAPRASAPVPPREPAAPVVPIAGVEIGPAEELTAAQQAHLDELTARLLERTGASRRHVERYRARLADNRNSVGFRPVWKDLVYPLVADRSQGSRIWDLDGNEYVDLTMGFGVNLLGHRPPFVVEAVREQLERGIHLGPQSDLAGEVADRLCRLTGHERAIFSNSGTEAVMIALRLARTVSGRSEVAAFDGSYHGFYDGTLGRRRLDGATVPSVAGIPAGAVDDLTLLEYGSDEALEAIRARADRLAAVLVEPVQSRRPSFQPREFLHRLAEICRQAGIALIFDEMVTGFRCHPGGAAALFGVEPDIATYGKAVGGGMPVGVIAGRGRYLDAVDGGVWTYGDDSYPTARQTLFAGTFCKHPLAMAAARSVLRHLEEEGPALQESLDRRTAALQADLNAFFDERGVPLRVDRFSSLFNLRATGPWRHADLLRFHLALEGVYTWEGATRYLSTAHTDEDVETVKKAVRRSVDRLVEAGFLESRGPGGTAAEVSGEGRAFPLSDTQRQVWILARMGPEVSRAYNESVILHVGGALRPEGMARAVQGLVDRHEALRSTFGEAEAVQTVHPAATGELPAVDLSGLPAAARAEAARRVVRRGIERPFDLSWPPLLRAWLLRLGEDRHQLVLLSHHLITDARAFGVLLGDLRSLYLRETTGEPRELPPAPPLTGGSATGGPAGPSPEAMAAAEAYWTERYADGWPVLDLPTDFPRPAVQSYDVARHAAAFPEELGERLRELGAATGATLFSILLSSLDVLLYQLSGQRRITVGINATRPGGSGARTVSFQLDPLAFLTEIDSGETFRSLLGRVRGDVLDAYQYLHYPLERLRRKVGAQRDPSRFPLGAVVLNLGRGSDSLSFGELDVEVEGGVSGAKVELYFEVAEREDGLRLTCDYSSALFAPESIARWVRHWETLLFAAADDPDRVVAELPRLPDESGRSLPMTEYQRLLWAGQRLHPGVTTYVGAGDMIIPAELDIPLFQEAVRRVLEASDVLRAVLWEEGGNPTLEVVPAPPAEEAVRVVDLSERPDPEAAWKQVMREQMLSAAALTLRRPMHCFALARLGPDHFRFLVSCHHIVFDGIASGVLWSLIAETYDALAAGREPDLEITPFREFVLWQREALASEAGRRSQAFWEKYLAQPFEPLEPFGRRPAADRSRATVRYERRLPQHLMDATFAFAGEGELGKRPLGVGVASVFSAAITVLLWRIGGIRQACLGTPFKMRPDRRFDRTPGQFMHMLPVRIEVGPDDTFRELACRAADRGREAARHQITPLANSLDRRLYEVEYNFAPLHFAPIAGTSVVHLQPPLGHGNELLMVEVAEFGEGGELGDAGPFHLIFDFNRDVFTPKERERTLDLFLTVLEEVTADPDRRLGSLPLLGEADRGLLASELILQRPELPLGETLPALFRAQVERTPDAPAVSGSGDDWSYRELAAAAGRAAAGLRAEGVRPGDLVALFQHRSSAMAASILALWQLRAAYLPLDVGAPAARTREVLAASGARRVIVDRALGPALAEALPEAGEDIPWEASLTEALLDTERPADGGFPPGDPGDLAYVIYTSGSTGSPKGVMVEQRGMVNHLFAKVDDLELTADDVVLQSASPCFDISVWQFFAPLLVGGRVEIADDETAHDPRRLLARTVEQGVTVAEVVPSLLGLILDELEHPGTGADGEAVARPEGLRWMMTTGETLPPELARRWLDAFPDCPLMNAYGPTECSDDVTHAVIAEPPPEEALRVSIGRPVANTRFYVCDRRGSRTPVGVPGELWVGGAGVGRGYLDLPGRTARVFIPDPFGEEPGERLYRTGDLVRVRENGELEHLGRIDFQVKIRGFRVEPGEIEAVLAEHPAVGEAVVRVVESGGRRSLAAYVAPRAGGAAPAVEALRRSTADRLPDYMVPATFTILEEMPRTATGKVDRGALPDPERPTTAATDAEPPASGTAALLAAIWQEVLGVDRVGAHDDFFHLGGDSLLAIRISSLASRRGLRVAPMDLFHERTLDALARRVEAASGTRAEQGRVTGDYPLLPIQRWFADLPLPDPHHWNQSLLLEVDLHLAPAQLEAALQRLTEHHDALRTRLVRAGEGWVASVVGREKARLLAFHDLSSPERHPDDAGRAETVEAVTTSLQGSLRLDAGPLLRAALFRYPEGRPDRFFLTIHHLVVDAVSWPVLLEDLQALLTAGKPPAEVELPLKTTSFPAWARRLEEWAAAPEMAGTAEEWLALLPEPGGGGLPAAGRLENGGAPAADGAPGGGAVSVELEEEETAALLDSAGRSHQGRVDAMILGALCRVMAEAKGEAEGELLVTLEGHGREDIFEELSLGRTVGWLASLYPVLLNARLGEAPSRSAQRVRRSLDGLPHRGLSFGVLRYLAPDADLRRRLAERSAAEVRFNYTGRWDASIPAGSPFRPAAETVGPSAAPGGEALFPLDLNAWVQGGRLRVVWRFGAGLREEAVRAWAERHREQLLGFLGEAAGEPPPEGRTADGGSEGLSEAASGAVGMGLPQDQIDEVLSALAAHEAGEEEDR